MDAPRARCRRILLRFVMLCRRSSMVMPVVVFKSASTLNSSSDELAVQYRTFRLMACPRAIAHSPSSPRSACLRSHGEVCLIPSMHDSSWYESQQVSQYSGAVHHYIHTGNHCKQVGGHISPHGGQTSGNSFPAS